MGLLDGRFARPLLLAAILVCVAFVASMLSATGGHAAPQVVDLLVVCQYAKAMAEGHPFRYNVGEAPSIGATSLLHTTLLAGAHAIGFRGEGLVAFAIALGATLFVFSVLVARRIGSRLASEREGALAGALVLFGGPVVWGFLYGSDTGLFLFLALLLFDRFLAEWSGPAPKGTAWVGSLLCLARPEGLPVTAAVALAWSVAPGRGSRGRARLLAWIPVAVGVAVLALYRAVSGSWVASSLADKSLVARYGAADALALSAEYAVDVVRGLLLGFYPSQAPVGLARGWASLFFPPLGLLLVLLACLQPKPEHRTPLRVWALTLAGVSAIAAPNVFMGVHFNRYILWAFPSLLVLVAVGLGRMTRLLGREAATEGSLFRLGAGLLLVLGALSTARFALLYGEMAGSVQRRDVAAAEWISSHLPPGVSMANVATSVEYLTGHRNTNLHGVTSPAFFGGRPAEREANAFEALGRIPEAERPEYLLSSEATQEAFPTLRRIVDEPAVFRGASLADDLLVFRMRYDLVGANRQLVRPEILEAVKGLREVDRLNVCDPMDERRHEYRFASELGGIPLWGTARIASYGLEGGAERLMIDGGRAILGEESFAIDAEPGKDALVVLRTAPSQNASIQQASGVRVAEIAFPEARVSLEIGGLVAARASFAPRPGWDELALRIPGAAIRTGRPRLRISGRYASFYYTIFQ